MSAARDEAAQRHAESVLYPNRKTLRPVDEYSLEQMRQCSADDFAAGWDAGREELQRRPEPVPLSAYKPSLPDQMRALVEKDAWSGLDALTAKFCLSSAAVGIEEQADTIAADRARIQAVLKLCDEAKELKRHSNSDSPKEYIDGREVRAALCEGAGKKL